MFPPEPRGARLAFTLGCDKALIAQLDAFCKKRNISDHERAGGVSIQETEEMQELNGTLRDELAKRLSRVHPDLSP